MHQCATISKKVVAFLALVVFSCLPFLTFQITAQTNGVADGETVTTNPKNRTNTVTASVSDGTAPDAPILISPTDGGNLSTPLPTFVWKKSDDNLGVDHYRLVLDGSTLFDDIPTGETSNSLYTLTFDSSTNYYSLTVKNAITDGSHTWKVTAYDAADNNTSSATWSFTIDSLAPSFVITSIEQSITSISAQDLETVPTDPFVLSKNSPLLAGTGEANSTVTLTMTVAQKNVGDYTFVVQSDGTWSLQLGILQRDVIIYLDFLITDGVGNISLLSNVPLILKSELIIIPGITEPIVSPLPGSTPETPPIIIKKPEPEEIVDRLVTTVTDQLSPNVRQYLQLSPIVLESSLRLWILSLLALILLAHPPFLSCITLLRGLKGEMRGGALKHVLQVIGLWPWSSIGGMVFESKNQDPVPYAKVTFIGTDSQKNQIRESVFTNKLGMFPEISLPMGNYQVHVGYEQTVFPSALERAPHIPWQNFYQGTSFTVGEDELATPLLIPLDAIESNEYIPKSRAAHILHGLRFLGPLSMFLAVVSLCVALLYPSVANIFAIALYSGGYIFQKLPSGQRKIAGFVRNTKSIPIENCILKFATANDKPLVAVVQSNSEGRFTAKMSKGEYVVYVISGRRKWADSRVTIDGAGIEHAMVTTEQDQSMTITLQEI